MKISFAVCVFFFHFIHSTFVFYPEAAVFFLFLSADAAISVQRSRLMRMLLIDASISICCRFMVRYFDEICAYGDWKWCARKNKCMPPRAVTFTYPFIRSLLRERQPSQIVLVTTSQFHFIFNWNDKQIMFTPRRMSICIRWKNATRVDPER